MKINSTTMSNREEILKFKISFFETWKIGSIIRSFIYRMMKILESEKINFRAHKNEILRSINVFFWLFKSLQCSHCCSSMASNFKMLEEVKNVENNFSKTSKNANWSLNFIIFSWKKLADAASLDIYSLLMLAVTINILLNAEEEEEVFAAHLPTN